MATGAFLEGSLQSFVRPSETVMMGMERRRVEIYQTSHRFIDGHLTRDGRVRPLTGIDPMYQWFTHPASSPE